MSVNPYIYVNLLLHVYTTTYYCLKPPTSLKTRDQRTATHTTFAFYSTAICVPKPRPFDGSSYNLTLFIVTSSKITCFRQNLTLFMETTSGRTTLHQSTGLRIISAVLVMVNSSPVLLDYECRRFL